MEPVADPLVGFRAWKVADDGTLRPMFMGIAHDTWKTGTAIARCHARSGMWGGMAAATVAAAKNPAAEKHPDEPAPNDSCMCGLYAYYRPVPQDLGNLGQNVWGVVVTWGAVVQHETGFRAQHARIVGLADIEGIHVLGSEIAAGLEVPFLPLDELELYGAMFGEVVTDEQTSVEPQA